MTRTDSTFGAAAGLLLLGAIVASLLGSGSTFAFFGTWLIAIGATVIYLRLRIPEILRARAKARQRTFVSDHGIAVFAEGFHVDSDEFDEVVDDYIVSNIDSPTFEKLHIQDRDRRPTVFVGLECWFTTYPFQHPSRPDVSKIAGLASLNERKLLVGWRERLADTALAHELDHFVRGAGTHCFATECREGEVPMAPFATGLSKTHEPLPPIAA